jgi:hypothetical protein
VSTYDEHVAACPACGSPIDYCQGHGEIGDPAGAAILAAHDDGDHTDCHPDGCDDAVEPPEQGHYEMTDQDFIDDDNLVADSA